MIIRKRQLVVATLVLALSAAVFINWYYTRPGAEPADKNFGVTDIAGTTKDSKDTNDNLGDAEYVNSSKDEYFADVELRRSQAHDEALGSLEDIIKDTKSDSEAIKKASEQLNFLSNSIKLESDIEALILAKTGLESVVLINKDKCEVVVENGSLESNGILQIKEIATKQTGLAVENITIIELSS
jgi:stage III sporulation protein AH